MFRRRWFRIVGVVATGYLLTWWPGGWAARRAIAHETTARLDRLINFDQLPAATKDRAQLRAAAAREGCHLESISRYDFWFNWSVPVVPGVIVSSYEVYVDGRGVADIDISSVVLWYAVNASVIGTVTGNGWQWGPAG